MALRNEFLCQHHTGVPRWWGRVVAVFVIFGGSGLSWGDEPPASPPAASDSIRLNTIGYPPDATKRATIKGGGEEFVIREARTGAVVYRGQLAAVPSGDASQEALSIADFRALDQPGEYRLEIPGRGAATELYLAKGPYNWPLYCSVRAMYLWRCGTAVTGEFGGDTFHHEACHLEDGYLDYAGGPAGKRKDSTGGWHDAGDYNKYTVNGAFTAGMMLKAWEHFGELRVW